MSICGNMVGSYSQIGKTFVITDEAGNELTGVATENEVIFTATDNDVRSGSVYAGDAGVSTGTKEIPSYYTTEGYTIIMPNQAFQIKSLKLLNLYDFTKLQCIICPFIGSAVNSVKAEKISVNEKVFNVSSDAVVSEVVRDADNKYINLGIINDTENMYVLRYFTYKEIY